MSKGTSAIFLAAALALSVDNAGAVPYTFTNIADSTGPFREFFELSLNDRGTVAFTAIPDSFALGIFTGSGGPTTTLYRAGEQFPSFGNISFNNRGTVAFTASLNTGETGIFTGSGGPTRTIVDFGEFFITLGTSLNNRGTVAFEGISDSAFQWGIFTGSGGPFTTIADISGEFADFSPWFALNDSGTVAFTGSLDGGSTRLFTGSGGPFVTIANSRGTPFAFFHDLSLNDSGTVAFQATLDNGASGIFTGSGGPTTTIADSRGPFDTFLPPSLNDSGAVVVSAFFDLSADSAILTGPDPLADILIAIGDPLFGSTVVRAVTDTESLNNAGQIAFSYVLADGRQGIARADPLGIPGAGTRHAGPACGRTIGCGAVWHTPTPISAT